MALLTVQFANQFCCSSRAGIQHLVQRQTQRVSAGWWRSMLLGGGGLIDSAETWMFLFTFQSQVTNHSNSHLGRSAAYTCSVAVSRVWACLLGSQPARKSFRIHGSSRYKNRPRSAWSIQKHPVAPKGHLFNRTGCFNTSNYSTVEKKTDSAALKVAVNIRRQLCLIQRILQVFPKLFDDY